MFMAYDIHANTTYVISESLLVSKQSQTVCAAREVVNKMVLISSTQTSQKEPPRKFPVLVSSVYTTSPCRESHNVIFCPLTQFVGLYSDL